MFRKIRCPGAQQHEKVYSGAVSTIRQLTGNRLYPLTTQALDRGMQALAQ